jgi:hypothetical protein
MFPGSHVLGGCSAVPAILSRSFQLCKNGQKQGNIIRGLVKKEGCMRDNSHVAFGQKFQGEKEVSCHNATANSFVTEVLGEVSNNFMLLP